MSKINDLNPFRLDAAKKQDTLAKILVSYLDWVLKENPKIKFEESRITLSAEDELQQNILTYWKTKDPNFEISKEYLEICYNFLKQNDFLIQHYATLSGNKVIVFNIENLKNFMKAYHDEKAEMEKDKSMNSETKMYLNWSDLDEFITAAVNHYQMTGKLYSGIYGIPRGGLIPAVVLSHRLHLPLLQAPSKDCIIVDDIHDAGETLKHYLDKEYDVAVLIYREKDAPKPENLFYQHAIDSRISWVVFPWEEQNA